MVEPITLINQTVQDMPVFSILNSGIDYIKILIGGLFGLSLISFFVSIVFSLKNRKTMKQIKFELSRISKRLDEFEKKAKKK
jgi:hypothetical protein